MLATLLLNQIRWHLIFDYKLAWESVPFVLGGFKDTMMIALASFLGALLGGLLLALMRISKFKPLNWLARGYVSFFRGVPLLVTLFFLYYGLPVLDIVISAFSAALIGFSLTGSAYTSEIIRSAIESIDYGQWEAAQSLGLNYIKTLRRIILPQAMRVAIPPLSNVIVDMIKSSSLSAMITVQEMFNKAKMIAGSEHDYMTMYMLLAIIYWVICTTIGYFQSKMEQHFKQYVA